MIFIQINIAWNILSEDFRNISNIEEYLMSGKYINYCIILFKFFFFPLHLKTYLKLLF